MCGIAGRILNKPGNVGNDLVELMDAQSHRGADSTGFAVYSVPLEQGFILRGMGFSKNNIDSDLENLKTVLREHQSDFLKDPEVLTDSQSHYCFRLEITEPAILSNCISDIDTFSNSFEIQSCGRSLEIIKDTGDSLEVAEKHKVRDMVGTHGLGHARLATESSVLPNASHPFWARPFPDVAIVHNGQITNYFTWKEKLERQGYRFLTENDSELIAVWVSDQIKQGLTLSEALKKSITSIDGVFTYMIAKQEGIGFAKDRFAMKPLVVVSESNGFAAATEEQAVRRIFLNECNVLNYDGPSITEIWNVGNRDLAA